MRINTVSWDGNDDNTKVTFSDDFVNSHRITKLDVLQDLMIMFEIIYEDVLKDMDNSKLNKTYRRNDLRG